MRRSIAWVAGIAGLLAALFLRRRHSQPALAEDPALELRRTLDAARARAEEEPAPEPEAPGAQTDEPASPAADADARRREVHDEARAAIDEMRRESAD